MKVCLLSSKEVQNPLQLDDFLLTKKCKKYAEEWKKFAKVLAKYFLQFDEKVEKVKNGESRKKIVNVVYILHNTALQ